MRGQSSENDTAPVPGLDRLFAEILQDLGGREFVLDWARNNPSDFMRLFASLAAHPAKPHLESHHKVAKGIHEESVTPLEVVESSVAAFTRQSAAEYLSISTRLLDDLLSAGEIKRVKLGRKTLVRKIDLDSYLASLAEEA